MGTYFLAVESVQLKEKTDRPSANFHHTKQKQQKTFNQTTLTQKTSLFKKHRTFSNMAYT